MKSVGSTSRLKKNIEIWESSKKHESFATDHLLEYDILGIYSTLSSVNFCLTDTNLDVRYLYDILAVLKNKARVLIINYSSISVQWFQSFL